MNCHSLIKVLGLIYAAGNLSAIAYADYRPITSDESAPDRTVTISTAPRYFQPINPSAPRSPNTSTGTRGDDSCFVSDVAPRIFAPDNFVGITASAQPQLTWFLPEEEPVPMEFSVYTVNSAGSYELEHLQMLTYESGITQYQLPVELEPGTRYIWQLVLECNPNRPSAALVYQAEMEFVPMVGNAMPATATALEKSEIYAKAGYWYDAISVLGHGQQPDVLTMRTALLNDLEIVEAAIAAPE
ncbi:MAG: DUF928 domain-containing protein [Cyanobacteria bacterium P01_B01_bin.77]